MIKLRKLKMMPLIIACTLLVAGIVILGASYAGFTEPALAILFGTLTLGVGTARLVYGFLTYREELDAHNNITLGVLDVIWGIVMLILNANSFAFVTLFGLWCLIAAVLEVVEIVRNAVGGQLFIHLLADAVINALFGIIMMIGNTFNGYFSFFIGIYLVLNALSSILITFLSIPGVIPASREEESAPAQEPANEPVEELAEEAAPEVEVVVPAKKTTKKSTTAKSTTAKSTAAKSTTAKKSTAAKKAPAKKPAAKKAEPKA